MRESKHVIMPATIPPPPPPPVSAAASPPDVTPLSGGVNVVEAVSSSTAGTSVTSCFAFTGRSPTTHAGVAAVSSHKPGYPHDPQEPRRSGDGNTWTWRICCSGKQRGRGIGTDGSGGKVLPIFGTGGISKEEEANH